MNTWNILAVYNTKLTHQEISNSNSPRYTHLYWHISLCIIEIDARQNSVALWHISSWCSWQTLFFWLLRHWAVMHHVIPIFCFLVSVPWWPWLIWRWLLFNNAKFDWCVCSEIRKMAYHWIRWSLTLAKMSTISAEIHYHNSMQALQSLLWALCSGCITPKMVEMAYTFAKLLLDTNRTHSYFKNK